MGGRGGASGFPTNAPIVPSVPQSAAETTDLQSLKQYMSALGVDIDESSLSGQTFENVRNAAAGIENVMKEFPQAADYFRVLRGEDLKKGVMANASSSGVITLANHYFSMSEQDFAQRYDRSTNSGFHPAGTNKDHVAVHEAGHVLERALIFKAIPGSDYWDRLERSKAWNTGKLASKVVSEGCREAKKTPAGKGMKNDDLIRGISGYATKNRSETLAECVADYAANGSNAKPLSVAVWKVLKRELG